MNRSTVEGLRDAIAERLYEDWGKRDTDGLSWQELPEYRKATYRIWVDDYVLAIARNRVKEIHCHSSTRSAKLGFADCKREVEGLLGDYTWVTGG
jgi:hypothetical protein